MINWEMVRFVACFFTAVLCGAIPAGIIVGYAYENPRPEYMLGGATILIYGVLFLVALPITFGMLEFFTWIGWFFWEVQK